MNSCTADLTEVTVKPFFFSLLTCIRGGCLPAVLKRNQAKKSYLFVTQVCHIRGYDWRLHARFGTFIWMIASI